MVRLGLTAAAAALIVAAVACGGGSPEKQPEVIATVRATPSPTPSPAQTAPPATATPPVTAKPTGTGTPVPSETPTPAANRNPSFPQGPLQGVSTSYVRDADNVITSAETTMLSPAATDPDGDTLTYTWSVTTGTILSSGLQAFWTREIIDGHETPGRVTVTASDGRGGSGTLTVDFQ